MRSLPRSFASAFAFAAVLYIYDVSVGATATNSNHFYGANGVQSFKGSEVNGFDLKDGADNDDDDDDNYFSNTARELEMTILANVRNDLVEHRSMPSSYGVDNVGGRWNQYVDSDEHLTALLGEHKPTGSTDKEAKYASAFRRLAVQPRQNSFINALNAERTAGAYNGASLMPSNDMNVLAMRLTDSGRVLKTAFTDSDIDNLYDQQRLVCGSISTGGRDRLYVSNVSDTIAIADAVDDASIPFADSIIKSVAAADHFWNSRGMQDRGKVSESDLAEQIFSEAALRANLTSQSDHPVGSSLTVASFNGKSLNIVTGGTSSLHVYRRSERDGYRRYPFLTTSTSPSTAPWIVSNKNDGVPPSPETYNMPLVADDIIVMMSDGITDNLYSDELAATVTRAVSPKESDMLASSERLIIQNEKQAPWNLPHYSSATESSDQTRLQYTTHPEFLASTISFYARYHLSRDSRAGPHTIQSVAEGRRAQFAGRPGSMTAITCWVTGTKNKDTLQESWLQDLFVNESLPTF